MRKDLIAAVVLALAAGGAAQAPQAPARPPAALTVTVPVLVLDKQGEPIPRLDEDSFRLTDNGRPQRLASFSASEQAVSLAIVVDTRDRDAVADAGRSAELMAGMVIGAAGEAAVYDNGPQPRQVLGFTRDQAKLTDALRHLQQSPQAPLGKGAITAPVSLALVALTHRPAANARAIIIIGAEADRGGDAAQALATMALEHDILIFRVAPVEKPKPPNPVSVEARGTGQGSQRDPNVLPTGALPGRPGYKSTDQASVNLTPALGEGAHIAAAVLAPHRLDYVYDSGGVTLSAGDAATFDRELSSIGADLRGLYRLSYVPDDARQPGRHFINVSVQPLPGQPKVGRLAYRRGYVVGH